MPTDQLNRRLETLKSEHGAGQKMLAELDEKRKQLTTTMLRIEGAMAVLQELITEEGERRSTRTNGAAHDEEHPVSRATPA